MVMQKRSHQERDVFEKSNEYIAYDFALTNRRFPSWKVEAM